MNRPSAVAPAEIGLTLFDKKVRCKVTPNSTRRETLTDTLCSGGKHPLNPVPRRRFGTSRADARRRPLGNAVLIIRRVCGCIDGMDVTGTENGMAAALMPQAVVWESVRTRATRINY